jgi:hypothetical protein
VGRRSKVSALPQDVVDELNSRLINSGFRNYTDLSDWLKSLGYDISKSAVGRHGLELEAEFEEAMADARRTRALARAAREAGGENDNAMLEAATEIMQDNLLRVSMQVKNDDDPTQAAKTLSLVARAFADVGRLDIARQKWQTEVQARAEETAAKVEKLAKKGGMSATTVDEIKRSILGIAS